MRHGAKRGDMSFHRFFFKAIDHIYEPFQNRRRCTKFGGVQFDIARDIVYDNAFPDVCRLDVCRLKGEGKAVGPDINGSPVVLCFHGGGFAAGDKHCRRALARWLAVNGYAVVNVNYGLAPEYKFPSQHRHIVSALGWLQNNAQKYGLDIGRVVFAGDSAGAYYAAMLACLCVQPDLARKLGTAVNFRPRGVILNCGVYDMPSLATDKMMFNLGKYIFRDITGMQGPHADGYMWGELLSIPALVTPDFPPALLIYASRDTLCGRQHEGMIAALHKNNVPLTVYAAQSKRYDHCFSLMWKGEAAEQANAHILSFLSERLGTSR